MAEKWTVLTIGLIMIISPWALGFSDISLAKWCNVLIGLVLGIMAAWAIFGERPAPSVTQDLPKEPSHKK